MLRAGIGPMQMASTAALAGWANPLAPAGSVTRLPFFALSLSPEAPKTTPPNTSGHRTDGECNAFAQLEGKTMRQLDTITNQ
ncbi:hypothetical protein ZHAS_00006068 [Anopheles sinensis]|uniref:Uncharacterized protein n=1 Tax=Anopheles sinensis TaxID=74873 RepID=A0A084VL04_ANOSI|nr:hypothetical protein ZHAS_00006068 [Anopheles sinensis]